jgi:hypothetical protein
METELIIFECVALRLALRKVAIHS